MMKTQLDQIAKKAKLDPKVRFTSLAHLARFGERRLGSPVREICTPGSAWGLRLASASNSAV
jgi:hypothetical protein